MVVLEGGNIIPVPEENAVPMELVPFLIPVGDAETPLGGYVVVRGPIVVVDEVIMPPPLVSVGCIGYPLYPVPLLNPVTLGSAGRPLDPVPVGTVELPLLTIEADPVPPLDAKASVTVVVPLVTVVATVASR